MGLETGLETEHQLRLVDDQFSFFLSLSLSFVGET